MTTSDSLTDDGLIVVNSEDEVPDFATEAEEAAFWDTHTFGPGLLARMKHLRGPDADPALVAALPPARPRSSPVTIRLNADLLYRLRLLASARGVGYQTLMKQFVTERLYEEERRAP
jgi:CopG antitoxin of type II toxin-antitoxin system